MKTFICGGQLIVGDARGRLSTANTILRDLSDENPYIATDNGRGSGWECRFCERFQYALTFGKREPDFEFDHNDECTWVMAKMMIDAGIHTTIPDDAYWHDDRLCSCFREHDQC